MFKNICVLLVLVGVFFITTGEPAHGQDKKTYIVVDTGQNRCYDNFREISYPKSGESYYGQDAHYAGNKPTYRDDGDGTITDLNTGLMWTQNPGSKKTFKQALAGASQCRIGGYDDWRLPNAKELQTIVDYSRSPDTSNTAAIDPIFKTATTVNEVDKNDFPNYWSSTTHASVYSAQGAAYIAFGRSLGWMQDRRTGNRQLLDVHGAGSQRSDPKSGDPSKYPYGRGPQGDVIRIYNYVRPVRGGVANPQISGPKVIMTESTQRPPQDHNRGDSIEEQRGMSSRGFGKDFQSHFVERLDRNNDGKVSRSEFDGPQDHFRHMDRNNDGYLSVDEAPAAPPPHRR